MGPTIYGLVVLKYPKVPVFTTRKKSRRGRPALTPTENGCANAVEAAAIKSNDGRILLVRTDSLLRYSRASRPASGAAVQARPFTQRRVAGWTEGGAPFSETCRKRCQSSQRDKSQHSYVPDFAGPYTGVFQVKGKGKGPASENGSNWQQYGKPTKARNGAGRVPAWA